MKGIFILCALTLAAVGALVWRATAKPSRYGDFTGALQVDVASLIAAPKLYVNKTVAVEGKISEQCQTMGCYFFFRSGKDKLRVDVQAIAMTAPMHEGRQARVEGRMVPYGESYQFYASAVEFL